MIAYLQWGLLHIGLLYLITTSAIASPVRSLLTHRLHARNPLVALLYCPGCMGFWLGLWEAWLSYHVVGPEEVVVGGVMGMALGALWGQTTHGPGVMYSIEQGWKKDQDDQATASAPSDGEGPSAGHDGLPRDERRPGAAEPGGTPEKRSGRRAEDGDEDE